MSYPIGFAQANRILNRPAGMAASECKGIEVFSNGQQCISRWQLTDEELAELNRNGGKLYLQVYGPGMPPIAISIESPFRK